MNKKNTILIVGIVVVLIIILIFVINIVSKQSSNNSGNNDNNESLKYVQCDKNVSDKEKKISNWSHNSLNYYVDKNNNRVNNSEFISKDYKLDNGIILSDMSIVSLDCNETKANLEFSVTNNSNTDIDNGTLHLYFKSSDNLDEVHISVNLTNIKKGQTKEINKSYKFRIIDALNYRANFVKVSEYDG